MNVQFTGLNPKSEYRISKQIQNSNAQKNYDLETRTLEFAKSVRLLVKKIPRTIANIEDAKQLIKSSGSIGANYIEANEASGKKDFVLRIKISRKEAKESAYWLKLLEITPEIEAETAKLLKEAGELMNIFGVIVRKSEN
jgi:four helix bundle protein